MALETIPLPATPEGFEDNSFGFDIVFRAGEVAAAATMALETKDTSHAASDSESDETKAFTCGATNNTCLSCRETDCVTCRCTAGVTCGCGE